jgi:hypothetical protein
MKVAVIKIKTYQTIIEQRLSAVPVMVPAVAMVFTSALH